MTEHKKNTTYCIGNLSSGLGLVQKCVFIVLYRMEIYQDQILVDETKTRNDIIF